MDGTVDRKQLNAESLNEYYGALSIMQKSIHGMATAQSLRRFRHAYNANKFWLAISYASNSGNGPKTPVGVMLYQITGFQKRLSVKQLLYSNSLGKFLLLQWLAKHVDQVEEIGLHIGQGEAFETWVTDVTTCKKSEAPDTPGATHGMERIVIVEGLSGIPLPKITHGSGIKFVAKINDSLCAWNNAVFSFQEHDGKLLVNRVKEGEEKGAFNLSIQGLAALVMCGISPSDLIFKDWGNPSMQQEEILSQMFPTAFPLVVEYF